jgi:succinoglycan biosynthesis transport protein ExoP
VLTQTSPRRGGSRRHRLRPQNANFKYRPETPAARQNGYSFMNSTQRQKLDESFGSDLRVALDLVHEKWRLILLGVLVAGMAGAIYIIRSPNVYRAQAVIQVEQSERQLFKTDGLEAQDLKGEEFPKTIEQSLSSTELLLGLIKHNDLDQDPLFLPELKRPVSDTAIAEALATRVFAQVRRGTRLIDIQVADRKPIMAQRIAALLVTEYIRENFTRQMETSEMAYDFLRRQAERLKAKLAKSEQALQTYKEQHQAASLGEKENIVVAKLSELNRMVTAAKGTRLKLEADYAQIKKLGNGSPTALLAIPSIAGSPVVVEAQKTVAQKEAEAATLTQMYKEEHPIHTAVLKQLQELKAGLDRMILKAAEEVTSAYNSSAATEAKMEEALQEQERVALELNKISIPYNALRQEADSDRAFYESVLARAKETDVTKDVAQNTIRVVSHPLLPERPVSPNKTRILLLSMFGGLALGCGLSLLSRAFDRSLRGVAEAERRLGVPALGAVPKWARSKWMTDDLLLVEQPGSATAESFRSLRTSLSLLGKNAGHKTFLFTSALGSEGTSFCAINCAVAFAQQGLATLLIDADLRSPSIAKIFFDEAAIPGLTNILTHQGDLDDTARLTNIHKLSVLCAGTQLEAPAELLADKALGQLIRQASVKFDRVVVDSAPIQRVSDTLLLVGHVQATCLVASPKTSAEVASQAVLKIASAGSTLVGFILNRVSRQRYGAAYGRRYPQNACARPKAGSRKRPTKSSPQLPGPALQEW